MGGRTDWSEAALFMRDEGATEATWDSAGNLISLKLGADPKPPAEPKQTQRPLTPEEQMKQRAERQRAAFSASGRAVALGDRDS